MIEWSSSCKFFSRMFWEKFQFSKTSFSNEKRCLSLSSLFGGQIDFVNPLSTLSLSLSLAISRALPQLSFSLSIPPLLSILCFILYLRLFSLSSSASIHIFPFPCWLFLYSFVLFPGVTFFVLSFTSFPWSFFTISWKRIRCYKFVFSLLQWNVTNSWGWSKWNVLKTFYNG